jgi:hypothetical protein
MLPKEPRIGQPAALSGERERLARVASADKFDIFDVSPFDIAHIA